MSMSEPLEPEPEIIYATVRDGYDEWHIECRFADGQKYAAVKVSREFENLAHRICDYLNRSAG